MKKATQLMIILTMIGIGSYSSAETTPIQKYKKPIRSHKRILVRKHYRHKRVKIVTEAPKAEEHYGCPTYYWLWHNPPCAKCCKIDFLPMEKAVPKFECKTPLGGLTGTFDLTSNYVFRGITLSANMPAVQGGYTYTPFGRGIYAFIWASNTKLYDVFTDNFAFIEIDTGAGIADKINDNWTYDFSIVRYNYPRASGLDYNEFIFKLTYSCGIYHWSPVIGYSYDVFNSDKPGTYYGNEFWVDVPECLICVSDVKLGGTFGHYSLPRDAGVYSYNDYSAYIKKKSGIYTISATITDTSHTYSPEFPGQHGMHIFATLQADFG